MQFQTHFLYFIDASSVDWRTAEFDPSNSNQLWRQDYEGRIINKANGKVLVMDLFGFRFEVFFKKIKTMLFLVVAGI